MKAITYTEYGPPEVLRLAEIEKPVPKANEILIRIHAVSIGYGDILARNFRAVTRRDFNMPSIFLLPARMEFGFRKPKKNILGTEFSGEVEAVGKNVAQFKEGDRVFGYRAQRFGANVEYLCIPENECVTIKPDNMSFDEAAAVPYGGITALSLLRNVNIQKGQKVLINGASGSIGQLRYN